MRSRRAAYIDEGIIQNNPHHSINREVAKAIGDSRTESTLKNNKMD